MSCTNFSANTQPKVVFAGSLSGSFCHTTWPATFQAFVESLTGVLPDNYSTFLISDSEPAASDRDKVWVKVDSLTCRPSGIKLYLNGTWIDIGANLFYGVDESVTDDLVLVNSTNPVITWAQDGHMFIVVFDRPNTGPATITIKNGATTVYSSIAIKKFNNLPLEPLDYLAGMIGIFVYNEGTNTMRLTNPRVGGGTSTGGGAAASGFNLSFDEDADGDGEPDAWDVFVNNEEYDIAPTETAPAGGTFAFDEGVHGKQSVKFVCAQGPGNGGGFIQTKGHIEITANKIQEFSWWCKTTTAEVSNRVEVLWYDSAKAYISKTELWSTITANPNGVWYQLGGIATPPSTARYCKIRLYAGIAGTVVGGTVWFDDVRLEAPRFRFKNEHETLGSYNIKIPVGVFQVKATISGGGGAGGLAGNSASAAGAGGGGGGGTVIAYLPVVPGSILPCVVGVGGDAQTAARNGGWTRLTIDGTPQTHWIGNGGAGGMDRPNVGTVSVTGGAGGTAVVPLWGVGVAGQSGYPLVGTDSTVAVHWGGNSALGAGGPSIAGTVGAHGSGYGGGGGGGFNWGGVLDVGYGGEGASGVIILEYI